MGCTTGLIDDITHFGVYKKGSEADQRSLCTSEGVSVSTGLQCAELSSRDHSFFTDKLSTCTGQQSCMIHGVHDEVPIGPQPGNAECTLNGEDTLYIQYSCKVDEKELHKKREQALLASCTNIFCALTLLAVIKYRQGSISIEKREWDLQTVTASDYTLELKFTKEQVQALRNEMRRQNFLPYETEGLRFKCFLQQRLEDVIKEISGEDGGRIVDINFAYHNSWLLDSLRQRGEFIKFGQWDRLNEINKTITQRIHEDMEMLVLPKCAFVTMESETAYNHLSSVSSI